MMCVSLFDWKTVDFIVDKVYIALGENVWTYSDVFFSIEVKREKTEIREQSLDVQFWTCNLASMQFFRHLNR